jgi:hypothetical protein
VVADLPAEEVIARLKEGRWVVSRDAAGHTLLLNSDTQSQPQQHQQQQQSGGKGKAGGAGSAKPGASNGTPASSTASATGDSPNTTSPIIGRSRTFQTAIQASSAVVYLANADN